MHDSNQDKLLVDLGQGDLRTNRQVDQVVARIENNPEAFKQVFEGLYMYDKGLRMRCADALEKAARNSPALLQPYKKQILHDIALIKQKEVQWHVAQMLGYLDLTQEEVLHAAKILEKFFTTSKSNIVRVYAMQTLSDLTRSNLRIKPKVDKLIEQALHSGIPSLTVRARRLSLGFLVN